MQNVKNVEQWYVSNAKMYSGRRIIHPVLIHRSAVLIPPAMISAPNVMRKKLIKDIILFVASFPSVAS